MPPKGSGSQASTLVSRGGSAAGAGTVAPRQAAAAGGGVRTRRQSAARPGYFYMEDSAIFQLSPQHVLWCAVAFIVSVFMLHIIGKNRYLPRRSLITRAARQGSDKNSSLSTSPLSEEPALAADIHVTNTIEAAQLARSGQWARERQQENAANSSDRSAEQGRVGLTENGFASASGKPGYTPIANVAAAHTALRPPPPPNNTASNTAMRYFTLGAVAAVSLHYLVNFVGTLPVIQRLFKRFIWFTQPKVPLALPAPDDAPTRDSELNEDGETVEWVNMCWRKAWRVYQRGLERWLADLLQPVFDGLVTDGVVPRYVQRLRIAEFTLDHEAPYFSNMRRRSSRKDSDLNGVVDVRYTGGARMLLLIECGTGNKNWRIKVPVMVSELDLECKMWLKVRLAPLCPWLGTISLAFVGPPSIKVQLAYYNRVRLMRIPILQAFLTKLLTVDLPGLMTLPRRLEINIPPALTAVAEAAVGRDAVMRAVASAVLQADALEHALLAALPLGPQGAAGGVSLPDMFSGELQVTLHEARDLPTWGFPWQSNPYCRLALGNQAVMSRKDNETSHASSHRAPVWNQEFQFLAEDLTNQALELWIYDAPITGRTNVAYAKLELKELPEDGTLDMWLPVESTMPGEKTDGAVRLSVTYKSFQDDAPDSGYREAAAYAALMSQSDEAITDIKSAADASSRANVAASAAATAVAVTKAAAARAAARLARAKSLVSGEEGGNNDSTSANSAVEKSDDDYTESDDDTETNGASSSKRIVGQLAGQNWTGEESSSSSSGSTSSATIEADVVIDETDVIITPVVPPSIGSSSGNSSSSSSLVVDNNNNNNNNNGSSSSSSNANGVGQTVVEEEADKRSAAIDQLQEMTATMHQLTQEVESINASRKAGSKSPKESEAATAAAARAVAAAEALAATAVAAGDVAGANTALHAAAVALENTVAGLGIESPPSLSDQSRSSSGITVDAKKETMLDKARRSIGSAVSNGSNNSNADRSSSSRTTTSSGNNAGSDDTIFEIEAARKREEDELLKSLTPEDRAARALEKAREAAAAATAATAAMAFESQNGSTSSSISSTSLLSEDTMTTNSQQDAAMLAAAALAEADRLAVKQQNRQNRQRLLLAQAEDAGIALVGRGEESSGSSDESADILGQHQQMEGEEDDAGSDSDSDTLLAADAIPSSPWPRDSQQIGAANDGESSTEEAGEQGENGGQDVLVSSGDRPWWSKAFDFIPGVGKPTNEAAEAVADADGGAGLTSTTTTSGKSSSSSSLAGGSDESSKEGTGSTEGEEKEQGGPWWWPFGGGNNDNDNSGSETQQEEGQKGGAKDKRSSKPRGPEPVGDIILGSDIPIEEIAIEVQKSWKARDRHVETLVQKALESRQRQIQRPWVILLALTGTSSTILLSIVLYKLMHMPPPPGM